MVKLLHLSADPINECSTYIPFEIIVVLRQFHSIFNTPTKLPPRASGHTIPLIVGATPMYTRPYRYAPTLKDEIEKQVTKMLQAGII
jgi:hypothetical protein